jgi:hypothetical protein
VNNVENIDNALSDMRIIFRHDLIQYRLDNKKTNNLTSSKFLFTSSVSTLLWVFDFKEYRPNKVAKSPLERLTKVHIFPISLSRFI